jgi:phage repressor protein C with HTH and peptisase S24 domain
MASAPLTHNQIWTALDRLAARAKLSPSGLAKRAGLDPTTFNKSKRITPDGRSRWPSTESVAKALSATGVSIETFVSLITDAAGATQAVPLIGFAEAGVGGFFDDGGFPVGKGWDEIAFPSVNDEHAYALEISGDSMQPAYRDGDVIIVSPAAPVRRGDRSSARPRSRWNYDRSTRSIPSERFRLTMWFGSRASCGRVSRGRYARGRSSLTDLAAP